MILKELLAIIEAKDDYASILKAAHFKKRSGHWHHPLHGTVTMNKHGEWQHKPHGSTDPDDGFEGTTETSLERHLKKLQDNE